MNFKENIKFRESINNKVYEGKKATKEEKEWFAVNPCYNELYDFPCYQRDIIHLKTNCTYCVTITFESSNSCDMVIPLISVVLGKGEIISNFLLTDSNVKNQSKIKALGVLISNENPISSILFKSANGYMSVKYQSQYFDDRQNIYKREASTVNLSYGMKKEYLNENKVRYRCKGRQDEKNEFDALVFTIEWNETEVVKSDNC